MMGELVGLIDSMIIIQKGALVYQSTLDGFLEQFHCYAFKDEHDLARINVHRIERHKDMNRCFSFDQPRHLNPIECDLKRNIWVLLENTNDMRHYT